MIITLEYLESQPFEVVGNGREIRLNCPNCDDTTKHLYVNNDRSLWYCFKCGKGGKVHRGQYSVPRIETYAEKFTKDIGKTFPVVKAIKSLPANYKCRNIADSTPGGYLKKRGINEDEIVKYDIRISLEKSGPYKNCIIFPVYGWGNSVDSSELRYFVCRKYDDSKPKYVNAPWSKGDTLFVAMGADSNVNVIVEGIFDALAIARVGFNAIALLGKTATAQQLARLANENRYHTLIYLDSDALTHAVHLKLQLGGLGNVAQLVRQDKDAADLYMESPEALRKAIAYALKHSS